MTYPEVPLDGSGFLVPRREGWLMTAATFVSTKWPARRPDGRVMIRCSAGRFGDERHLGLDDAELVERLHGELTRAVDHRGAAPLEWRVDRWPRSFPQAEPGHLARVARIEAALPRHVFVAGAAYRGVGIASCIRQAREAGERVSQLT
jgi:oxygen-dependent protoporphyrinogen oxidase